MKAFLHYPLGVGSYNPNIAHSSPPTSLCSRLVHWMLVSLVCMNRMDMTFRIRIVQVYEKLKTI
jgi:hypothetical protein